MIDIKGLTKSYGTDKGVFDLTFSVKEGESFGFLGPNGAGKTTTIRHLMGFISPDCGGASIGGADCFKDAAKIHETVGYIAGEPVFFTDMKGSDIIRLSAALRNMNDFSRCDALLSHFAFDPAVRVRKMSKGMKQKLAIVLAFMHDPLIYIFDEPTSGLDPLMRSRFVELIRREKRRGKTMLMSSHDFEEVERTCERAMIIKHGRTLATKDIDELKSLQRTVYRVTLASEADRIHLEKGRFDIVRENGVDLEVSVSGDIDAFLRALSKCNVERLDVRRQSLEEIFMDYYGERGDVHV